ncbi:MAG: TolC family protein [gamma proteobacterium symbiont of Bathyaustriella thionipta]|nr:TolC family protein [gamma proteobacterium symbiont of Bathyaustriella thionipta]MCU7949267.1 TolC family protein [gamma proteobacterium symbiont of Bathyaustriella thionipta]MCU7954407.1 TolC family protein [gamma proteobacterium symbiont of Bathyaustriella thionipta]MCU7955872.1 TolC family protein [gamma proteobacterium symbiont of Bathyaustriella thionipta]MCU7967540.1 TolC family protein [gamma proteobacterium symbiont of Bathyaustriella thionipta]
MKLKNSLKFSALLMMKLCLLPNLSFAVSKDFVNLLDNIIEQQPEQQIIQGIQELHSANHTLSNSWISGDVELIVHHENDALTDNDDYKNWQVGVEFPIWLPDQKNAQKQVTASYGQELSAQQHYLRWLASNNLRRLAWNQQIATIEVEAARSALQKSQSLKHKVQQKVKAGESPRIDLLLANKAVSKQQNQLVQKQSHLTISQNQFQKWTQTRQLPQSIQERTLSPVSLDQHPKIIKLNSTLQISQAQLEKIKSFKKESPRLFLGAQNDKDRNSENTSLMFEVSIPLGMNPGYSPKIAQEKRNLYEKQALVDKAKMQIELEIFQAQQTLASAKQSIHFSKQQYDISQEALTMSESAYQLGEINIQNLLLVQQQSAEAKLNYKLVQARTGQAIADLNQISGHILGTQQ